MKRRGMRFVVLSLFLAAISMNAPVAQELGTKQTLFTNVDIFDGKSDKIVTGQVIQALRAP